MFRKMIALFLAFALLGSVFPVFAQEAVVPAAETSQQAAEAYSAGASRETVAQTPAVTNNINAQNYPVWSTTVKSYLVDNKDGTVTRVEATDTGVTVERYDAKYQFLSRQVLPMELPIFGGFYEGTEDFFLVFGQENPKEDDSVEVVRVVRYSKYWQRMGQASLYGANTTIPFSYGSLRMTQYQNMLYVHTCHTMYTTEDGYNHQANLIFSVSLPEMKVTDQYSIVMNIDYGYVSHSFNQFVLTDGDKLLTLNHGDAHLRSAVIVQYGKPAGAEKFTGLCTNTSVLAFSGTNGLNETGASLGAFELSDSAYLTAGNSVVQDGSVSLSNGQRNIFLGVTPRGNIGSASSTIRWITNYKDGANIQVSTPHLVRISGKSFLLLWTENGALRYVFVDDMGNTLSEIYKANMSLSDCKPIMWNNAVCWYVTQNSKPTFFSIPLDASQIDTPPTGSEDTPPTHSEDTPPADAEDEVPCDGGAGCPSANFRDVSEKDWYHPYVDYAVTHGLFNGMTETTFEPETAMTRAMLVMVLWRYEGMPKAGAATFTDVTRDAWYAEAVAWAAANGVVNGVGDNRFDPEGEITREQMAVILFRYAAGEGIDTSKRGDLSAFPDRNNIASWAKDAMQWTVATEIIGGSDGKLLPQGAATRAQVATILMRFIENVVK